MMKYCIFLFSHRIGSNRKPSEQLTNADQKSLETVLSLETEFFIVICRQTGNKWQSKTLFLTILDPPSLIVMFLIAAYPV